MKAWIDLTVQAVAMFMIAACYAPQITKLIKTKNADSQSLAFWIMLSIGLLANVYISIQSALSGGGWAMVAIQVVNTAMSMWTMVLVYVYQKQAVN